MIRINLLGVSKPRRRTGIVAPGMVKAPSGVVIAVVVVAITLAGNYVYYWNLQRQAASISNQMRVEQDKNRRLADIKAKYLELEKQKNEYEHRVNVINELAKAKTGPTELLNTIADTVNHTDAVWLNSMTESGTSVNLQGVALSVDAVAKLMQNLRATGRFRTVEMKETFQDDSVKEVQAFSFTLICERQAAQEQQKG